MDILPSLAPRDSHTLWYSPTHHAHSGTQPIDPSSFDHPNGHSNGQNNVSNNGANAQRRGHANLSHRTPLARLRLDEEYMERRKQNVQNYGNSWIKPPGIPKSLYQQREEKRELDEHNEALRREQLAAELAEAEAEGADELLQGEGMDEADGEEARDLDDDVPDAETTGLEPDDEEEDSDAADSDDEVEDVPRGVLASRVPEDVYREALIRGEEIRAARFGDEAGSTIDEEDQSQMLQEEDLVHETGASHLGMEDDMDMDMDADLDADIPEAESAGGYEHTDTEDELSTSEEESELPPYSSQRMRPAASSMVRSDGTQSSVDMDGRRADTQEPLDSRLTRAHQDSSSQIGSSPGPRSGLRGFRGVH